MESNDEDAAIFSTSDNTLSALRELSIRCKGLLHQLSAYDGLAGGAEARELKASFNIWAANMGAFREGQQSLASRLKSAPQISRLVQQLLLTLQHDLEKSLLQGNEQEDTSSANDSDDSMSSDRSSVSYRLLEKSDDDEALPLHSPRSAIWNSIQNTITSLRQLALTVRLAGTQHRQERIKRFANLDRNKQVFQLFERCARQKVDFLFPKASKTLRARMAESIATRRMRFRYLELHQKKTSTLTEPIPELQQKEALDAELPLFESVPQPAATIPAPKGVKMDSGKSVLSNTVLTKLDPKRLHPALNNAKRSESVSSVRISSGKFPSKPKLDSGGASFTCLYCFLVCPAKEANGQNQWM
ncbi:hypothetical protein LX32DRAFT_167054 [Colletotrichum zoysiae]|uniref:Fungal N-terminal domain-containing protein n=1 Tax=Colletotrichum zoysiae TaxID=1216348 RepID=A0AAD9HRP4_9PEZI|nr:hypothetical protein LX32DRAFT_167054 [Colletotrichum zoysiae]